MFLDSASESEHLADVTWDSMSSLNEILNTDALEVNAAWRQDLADRVEEIIDTKRSSIQGREKALASFNHYLILRHAEDEIDGKETALTQALLKSIKLDSSEKESVLALKALALLTVTSPLDTLYESVSSALKLSISDSRSMATKAAAIHALGISTFYGGASDDEILDNLAYVLEIIASDGGFIAAQDEPLPVAAALEEWGFLATEVSDIDALGLEEALETFTDQLASTSTDVQIAAGENIALLYEKADDLSTSSDSDSGSDAEDKEPVSAAKSYLERKTPILLPNLEALASLSAPSMSKKSRKSLHTAFASIAFSVQRPWAGPAYSSALKLDTGTSQGSRMKLKTEDGRVMVINRWWKLLRLNAYRRVLRDGLMLHLRENAAVRDAMPSFGASEYTSEKKLKREAKAARMERLEGMR